MRFKKGLPPRAGVFVLVDLLVFLCVIGIFAWIASAQGMLPSLRAETMCAVGGVLASPTPQADTPVPSTPTPTPKPTRTPTATPVPEVGDFSAAFQKAELAEGTELVYRSDDYLIGIKEYHVEDAVAHVAEVFVRDIHVLKTAFAFNAFKGIYLLNENIMQLCEENNALFAVSGDFVSIREDGTVIRNGEELQMHKYNDICVLRLDGTMQVYGLRGITRDELRDGTVWQTWCFGPNLLDADSNAMKIDHPLKRINPRCAIGYYEPGHYCFVIVDGRQKEYSDGMTLDEFSAFMAQLQCKVAYNLDGGQTAQMVLNDQLVNSPANGGRKVGDIIYIGRSETDQ